MIINNKADLNALRGTDAYAEALRRILGATTMWVNDAEPGEVPAWRQQSVGDALAQFDLTTEELLAECEAAGVVPQAPPQPVCPVAASSAEAVAAPPQLIAAAMSVSIANGDVAALEGAFNIAAAIYLGVGQVLLLFYSPMNSANYYVVSQGDVAMSKPTEIVADYFVVETRDGSGNLADPSHLCIQVYRV